MRILEASASLERFALTRPYAIAQQAPVDAVDNLIVRVETLSGLVGRGAASPAEGVTGETVDACRAALSAEGLAWLVGRDARTLPGLCRELRARMPHAPAARAAVDIALHDLLAQHLGVPLVEMLGRAHWSFRPRSRSGSSRSPRRWRRPTSTSAAASACSRSRRATPWRRTSSDSRGCASVAARK